MAPRPNLLFKRSARVRSPRPRRPGKFCSSISSAAGVHLASPSCQKLCGSGRAYKTGTTSNLLSWARTPVATPPERLRAFARRQHVTLPLAFDQGKKAHVAFGLSGFPGIVVIDRAGRVRLTRQGYNRLALVPASPPAAAGTNLPLMRPDDVPPDVPPASLNPE